MDILTLLQTIQDPLVVAGIIGLTEMFKSFDPGNRLVRFYVLIPVALGIFAAFFLADPMTWREVGKQAIIYAGASVLTYMVAKKTVLGK